VSSIGSNAFQNCINLGNVKFYGTQSPSYPSTIGVFNGCTNFTCVEVPSNYKSKKFCERPICEDTSSDSSKPVPGSSHVTSSHSMPSHSMSSHSGSPHHGSSQSRLISVASGHLISPSMMLFAVIVIALLSLFL